MYNFDFELPVKILFGENRLSCLSEEILKYGKRVLLCTGGNSIRKNGLYDKITEELSDKGIFFESFSGISPNPRLDEVKAGVESVKLHNIDFILAAGGGSTIDCAKAIAAGAFYEGCPWEFIKGRLPLKKALPLGVILTLSASGSEMNCGAVITNTETEEKLGFGDKILMPKFSILDPAYTVTVSKKQTAAGIADIMSHTFENYFTLNDGCYLQNRMAEAILKTCIYYGPIAFNHPENIEARANLMWAGSWAINGILNSGKNTGWSVHAMEHELSAFYGITHGVGLAILTPHWLKYVLNEKTAPIIAEYAKHVWDIKESDFFVASNLAIKKTSDFFASLEMPLTLMEVGINGSRLREMAEAATAHKGGKIRGFQELSTDDVEAIYKSALS